MNIKAWLVKHKHLLVVLRLEHFVLSVWEDEREKNNLEKTHSDGCKKKASQYVPFCFVPTIRYWSSQQSNTLFTATSLCSKSAWVHIIGIILNNLCFYSLNNFQPQLKSSVFDCPVTSNKNEISRTLVAYVIHNKVEIMDFRDPQRCSFILSMSRVN